MNWLFHSILHIFLVIFFVILNMRILYPLLSLYFSLHFNKVLFKKYILKTANDVLTTQQTTKIVKLIKKKIKFYPNY